MANNEKLVQLSLTEIEQLDYSFTRLLIKVRRLRFLFQKASSFITGKLSIIKFCVTKKTKFFKTGKFVLETIIIFFLPELNSAFY